MAAKCPSCGSRDYIDNKTCVCGYHFDDPFSDSLGSVNRAINKAKVEEMILKKLPETAAPVHGDEILIKEIDSWTITYSGSEKCISIGTPALQSFRLRIELDELESILEQIYQYSGEGKTIRKSQLSAAEMPELINKVYKKIEEKRRKITINFTEDEITEIMEAINTRLNS